MAKATSTPGHTVGSHAAAGSVKRARRFPFANRKGVGRAKAGTWGKQRAGRARVASPLLCWLPRSPNQGSRATTIMQSPIASGC